MLYDEALLERLDEQLAEIQGDVLIVLHTLGSHGPAYHKRYPGSFARFAPACKNDSPQSCTRDEVVNAYDNTILYTDHVLAELIDRLQARDKEQASFMLYASDHGESLGENGLYLHGVPNMFAPAEQTHVPMLAWLSPHYQQISGIDTEHMKRLAGAPRSHDNLSHSLLSLFGVHTTLYQADLDLFNQHGAMALRGSNELLGKR
jgi:lipid A ethanolaminephosphotransferase